MATDQRFVEHIQAQSGLGSELSYRRMFGEYAIYLHGKVVAFACDNQLFMKPTAEGRALLGSVSERPAYPGSKLYFRIDAETEDREKLRALFQTTARALPLPKAKGAAKSKSTKTSKTGSKPKPTASAAPKAAAPAKRPRNAG